MISARSSFYISHENHSFPNHFRWIITHICAQNSQEDCVPEKKYEKQQLDKEKLEALNLTSSNGVYKKKKKHN